MSIFDPPEPKTSEPAKAQPKAAEMSAMRSRHAMFPEERPPSDEQLDRIWNHGLQFYASRR